MSTSTEERNQTGAFTRTGTVTAVCYSTELINNVGKTIHDEAQITTLGIQGDKHYGETRYSSSQRATVPNKRTITVVGVEATREACEALGVYYIPPGGLGENILTEGVGNLGELVEGDEVAFYSKGSHTPNVILRV